jgi:hypothetical protein
MTTDQHTRRRPAIWRAVRGVAAALRTLRRENTLGWELWWQANRATVSRTGPLTWVLTLDGHQLVGSHLPTPPSAPPETRYERRLRSNSLLSRQDMWSGLGCSSGSLALTLKRGHADPPAQLHQDRN